MELAGCKDFSAALEEERKRLMDRANEEHEKWRSELCATFDRMAKCQGIASVESCGPMVSMKAVAIPPKRGLLTVLSEASGELPELSLSVPSVPWKPYLPESADPVPEPPCLAPDPELPSIQVGFQVDFAGGMERSERSDATVVSGAASQKTSTRRHSFASAQVQQHVLDLLNEDHNHMTRAILDTVKRYIDYFAGLMVLLNSFVLIAELEVEGRTIAFQMNFAGGEDLSEVLPILRTIDAAFVLVFVVELILRFSFEGLRFFLDLANMFDAFLVALGVMDMIISQPFTGGTANDQDMALLKLTRALKSMRAVRILRSFRFVRGLRVLVKACRCFLPSLFWSMALLAVFMSMGALTLGNTLQVYILDESLEQVDREWLWDRYGTSQRSTWTLYEVTFAGNWPTNARPVMEKADGIFALFFLLYITVVVFALIRVISAIFLKDTLDVVQNDSEQMLVNQLKKRSEDVQKLEGVFRAIDKEGTGLITEDRLDEVLCSKDVVAYLQTLDVDVHEGHALFRLMDNGDGEVTLDEFIDGIMRCKGPARAIDQVALHVEVKNLDQKLNEILKCMKPTASSSLVSPRTKSITRQKTQAAHLKPFRLDAEEQSLYSKKSSLLWH
mmetsp:Transcript_22315/g.51697  ORF Transcript_22315/g.51697 Transcript_22315/m.51697 type:complete len:616 (-) Transcript_22315:60-1907(-)